MEKAGEELVYVEKAPIKSSKFAYFKKEFGKEYMTYTDFMNLSSDPAREFNYYFAEEAVPEPIHSDIINPPVAATMLKPYIVNFWQGIGTVSLAHNDDAENIMCVLKGSKTFTIISPFHTHYVYTSTTPGMPPNYSPVDFDNPDLKKHQKFSEAKVYSVKIEKGDCMYLPAFWWHQVTSSDDECLAVSHWYHTHSDFARVANLYY